METVNFLTLTTTFSKNLIILEKSISSSNVIEINKLNYKVRIDIMWTYYFSSIKYEVILNSNYSNISDYIKTSLNIHFLIFSL